MKRCLSILFACILVNILWTSIVCTIAYDQGVQQTQGEAIDRVKMKKMKFTFIPTLIMTFIIFSVQVYLADKYHRKSVWRFTWGLITTYLNILVLGGLIYICYYEIFRRPTINYDVLKIYAFINLFLTGWNMTLWYLWKYIINYDVDSSLRTNNFISTKQLLLDTLIPSLFMIIISIMIWIIIYKSLEK